jgi:N-methylhydantoinase B
MPSEKGHGASSYSAGFIFHADPITVEVIGAALSSIVEEIGEALIRASFSTNVKERRDCSTACSTARAAPCARPSTSRCISAASSALEIEYPLTLLRYELVENSGGPGKFRGGMGLRRVYRAEAECRLRLDVSRLRSQSWGLFGGLPGGGGRIEPGQGVTFDHDNATLQAGQWFAAVMPGAGGYGPPAERDRAAVARDVAQGVIDQDTARRVYGYS